MEYFQDSCKKELLELTLKNQIFESRQKEIEAKLKGKLNLERERPLNSIDHNIDAQLSEELDPTTKYQQIEEKILKIDTELNTMVT